MIHVFHMCFMQNISHVENVMCSTECLSHVCTECHVHIFSPLVDARRLALPNGSSIFVLVKEGVIYLPNPELAKILPAVSRTAMDHIRNSYGITVTQVGGWVGGWVGAGSTSMLPRFTSD